MNEIAKFTEWKPINEDLASDLFTTLDRINKILSPNKLTYGNGSIKFNDKITIFNTSGGDYTSQLQSITLYLSGFYQALNIVEAIKEK